MSAKHTNTSTVAPAIEVHEVSKAFGKTWVLDDVSFTCAAGEVVTLLGPNGAGKSTLLKCLLGLSRCFGDLRVDGVDARRDGKRARRRIGYLPQAPAFPAYLTTGDALEFLADLRGLRGEDIDARLAAAGLTAHEHKPVGALSGGLRQRLGLAAALLGDPPVLLMDEPAAGLDPEGREWLGTFIANLRAEGRTVLLATHVLHQLDHVADRALVLEAGKLTYDGPLADLLDDAADGVARSGRRQARVAALLDEPDDRVEDALRAARRRRTAAEEAAAG